MKQIILDLKSTADILELIGLADHEIAKTKFWIDARDKLNYAITTLEQIEKTDPHVICFGRKLIRRDALDGH